MRRTSDAGHMVNDRNPIALAAYLGFVLSVKKTGNCYPP